MENLFAIQYAWLIPLLPLIGAAIAGFFVVRWLKGNSHWPIWIGVGLSALLSLSLLIGMLNLWHPGHETEPLSYNRVLFDWITAGNPADKPGDQAFNAQAGFFFDPLTAVMLCVVTGIGFFITVFAAGYMKGEEGYFRFFAYLGLFIFMMCCLVMGNNLIMLYLGWEGVGLCSYLLIGYYYERPSAREAAKKAFLVNRVGDFGFGLGIMLCFLAFGTITYFSGAPQFTGLLELAQGPRTEFQRQALQWIPFLLMLGAFGKSAQFPLHVWLPDAMEGPTPVSALIHAATMVTAGVYMIVRCGTLFVGNSAAMWTIALVGCFTALFAGSIALRQFDLKKVFAYSTVSQLGFMFVGVGVLAPVAGVFHLITHAFFKALLFLSSGVVMHAMTGELDMRKMSGLKHVLPKTRWLMLIGCLALAGAPPLAGFFSKDEIIVAAYTQSRLLAALMLLAAFMTSYYTFRLYFRVFEGPLVVPPPPPAHAPEVDEHMATDSAHHGAAAHDAHDPHAAAGHDEHHAHDHEPGIMIFPLIVLAFGAIVAGALGFSEQRGLAAFLGQSPSFARAYHTLTAPADHPDVSPMAFGQVAAQEEIDAADKAAAVAEHTLHWRMMIISALIAGLGIYIAYLMHLRDRASGEKLAQRFAGVTRVLEAKFWVDEVYQNGIVEPLRTLGRFLFHIVDVYIIDGLVWTISFIPQAGGFVIKFLTQRGYLQGYAVTMLIGIAVILLIVLFMTGLLLLILLPALGAASCALWPKRSESYAKYFALAVSLLTLFVGVLLAGQFDWKGGTELKWGFEPGNPFYLDSIRFGLKLGADSISLWLVLLTVLLTPLAILASFQSIKDRSKEYYAWMLALLAVMNGVFVARDLLLFYIFFELTLVPMFFIIGIWGGPQRRYAAGKFFLFTFSGSVFMLAGIIFIGVHGNDFDLANAVSFAQQSLSPTARWWLLLAFLAGFAVKVPLFPVHTWLPLAHTEAPTAGSVILAGVLLKLGTYGLLKLAVPIASPDAVATFAPFVGALCVIGVIYGALVAWVQQDIKKLVAYSSVSHLGFCVLGLFALNVIGVQGSVLYMINHGISTGALFLCVGMVYDRYHTRDINELSGLARKMPIWAFFMILFTLSSIGLPGTNGFVSEFLTILGAFTSKHLGIGYGSFAALGIILGAIYMLHMAARVVWGPLKTPHADEHHAAPAHGPEPTGELPTDLNAREISCLVPLALAAIILGWFPNIILKTIEKPVQTITQGINPPSNPAVAAAR